METPVQIVFHEVAHSLAIESLIRDKAGKLETIFPRLMRCHVSIEQPHRHKQQGNPFNVRIALHVPGGELVVNRATKTSTWPCATLSMPCAGNSRSMPRKCDAQSSIIPIARRHPANRREKCSEEA